MEKKLIGKLCPFRRETEIVKKDSIPGYEETSKREFFMECDPNCAFYYEKYIKTIHRDGVPIEAHYEMSCRRCDNFIKKEE